MLNLKECPFCGNEASLNANRSQYGVYGYVECDLCGARSKTKTVRPLGEFENETDFWKQEAFRKVAGFWNMRKTPKKQNQEGENNEQ